MKLTENPFRPCTKCGSTCEKQLYVDKASGKFKYRGICLDCDRKRRKEKVNPVCTKCGGSKEPTPHYWCNRCQRVGNLLRKQENLGQVTFLHKTIIKKFCERMIEKSFLAEISDLSQLIDLYDYIYTTAVDDLLSSGQQLQIMWNSVWSFYLNHLKGLTTEEIYSKRVYKKSKFQRGGLIFRNDSYVNLPKTCTKCFNNKMGSEFYWSKTKNRLVEVCKECSKKYYKKRKNKK